MNTVTIDCTISITDGKTKRVGKGYYKMDQQDLHRARDNSIARDLLKGRLIRACDDAIRQVTRGWKWIEEKE
ncbi:hypothetical protein LCGC14_1205520 [marine sediment metagenome]|uniref:Uncharacterized protein n=1 Tax=marine sediment metagenome TaxID=412755 RepID=A0A0F9M2Z0_9ZZZZ